MVLQVLLEHLDHQDKLDLLVLLELLEHLDHQDKLDLLVLLELLEHLDHQDKLDLLVLLVHQFPCLVPITLMLNSLQLPQLVIPHSLSETTQRITH